MEAWAKLLEAIAALLWPILSFIAAIYYRAEIRSLMQRIKKGKFLGQEVELEDSLHKLETETSAAIAAVVDQPVPQLPEQSVEAEPVEDLVLQIAKESAANPRAALLVLAAEIERLVREILQSNGLAAPGRLLPLTRSIQLLASSGSFPASLLKATQSFYAVRTQIAHGLDASEGDIQRAVDAGSEIYRALNSVPHAAHFVVQVDLPVFLDKDGTVPVPEMRAVQLRTEARPYDNKPHLAIYPARPDSFRIGDRVGWLWDMTTVLPECWYRDPTDAQLKYAWTSSAVFVGKQIG